MATVLPFPPPHPLRSKNKADSLHDAAHRLERNACKPINFTVHDDLAMTLRDAAAMACKTPETYVLDCLQAMFSKEGAA